MILENFLTEQKHAISTFLRHYISTHSDDLAHINALGGIAGNRLLDFSLRGKMIRGSLVLLGTEIASGKKNRDTIAVASAIELVHSGLLIHDDIMDHDRLRRGLPTVHTQFSHDVSPVPDEDYGISQAISVGDIAYFMAFSLIYETNLPSDIKTKIGQIISREIQKVGVAQMYDVHCSHAPHHIPQHTDIEHLYAYKTAHYTISLPLATGAIINNRLDLIPHLFSLGADMGTLFQIKDDYLGLWGNSHETGKPILNDIKEKKKTLYLLYALNHAPDNDNETLATYLASPTVSDEIAHTILSIIEHSGAKQALENRMTQLSDSSLQKIFELKNVPLHTQEILKELVEYIHVRHV